MLDSRYLRNVPLPEDLSASEIFQALQKTQDFFTLIREKTGIILKSVVQANTFGGIVSNVFTQMLGNSSIYKPYSEQRYPDLMHAGKPIGLEVKAANRSMKGGESHNGHSGWHIVVCYHTLENGDIEFTQVEIANLIGYELPNSDWKYQGSHRNENDSQRTETYTTTAVGTAKLRDGTVYLNPKYVKISQSLKKNRLALIGELPFPAHSPFAEY